MESEMSATYYDVVEVLVHPLPRQVKKPEFSKCFVHRPTLSQTAHIV
jgi:hypothetical protein